MVAWFAQMFLQARFFMFFFTLLFVFRGLQINHLGLFTVLKYLLGFFDYYQGLIGTRVIEMLGQAAWPVDLN